MVLTVGSAFAADPGHTESGEVLFIVQVVLLLISGRLLGEAMQRIGQPAVTGQLIAGVLLGPSVFGAIWPDLQRMIFPSGGEQTSTIEVVSRFGILMLLLLTGMETDLGVVKPIRRAAFTVSVTGIVLPFAGGFILGQFM